MESQMQWNGFTWSTHLRLRTCHWLSRPQLFHCIIEVDKAHLQLHIFRWFLSRQFQHMFEITQLWRKTNQYTNRLTNELQWLPRLYLCWDFVSQQYCNNIVFRRSHYFLLFVFFSKLPKILDSKKYCITFVCVYSLNFYRIHICV